MGTMARWLATSMVLLTLALGLVAAQTPSTLAATAQDAWIYYDNNGYGCLSHSSNGVETGHVICGGQVNGQWFSVGFDGDVWMWDGARWVNVYWIHTDGVRSYVSIYSGDSLVFRAHLQFYSDGSIGMIEVYPHNLISVDQTTAADTTATSFSGYQGSQMFSGLYNAPSVGPII